MESPTRDLLRLANACLDQALDHVRQSGLAAEQWAQFTLADMATELEVARLLLEQAEQSDRHAEMALAAAKETADRCCRRARHLIGEQGVETLPLSAIARWEGWNGPPDRQRLAIAKGLLDA